MVYELCQIVTLPTAATAYGMEVRTEESKIMTNSTNNISAEKHEWSEVGGGDQF